MRTLPAVPHSSYTVSEVDAAGNFTLPNRVNVNYACNEGYKLLYPQNLIVGCEYITSPKGERNDTIGEDAFPIEAVWTSTDDIASFVCTPGQYYSPRLALFSGSP
mgnify:CR=1 FL=1